MIIAIDGPAGAGKSTVAKKVSERLGFLYIDTGSMYRALTLKVIEAKIDIEDTARIIELARSTGIDLKNSQNGSLRIFLDGQDVTLKIRQPHITRLVSDIAKIKGIRQIMLGLQRRLGSLRDSVLEGRDIGTIVFPDAQKKFYIDAQFQERVKRRYEELKEMGHNVSFADVEEDLRKRDAIDSSREFAPLKKADDAIYIDTTDMTIDEVVNTLLKDISTNSA